MSTLERGRTATPSAPRIITGDCVEVMADMDAESIDAIVTDPPYGLEFMGKEWDRLGDIGKTSHQGIPERDPSNPYGRTRASFFGSSNLKCRKCDKWQWDHVGRKCECEHPDFPNPARHQGLLMQQWHQRWATEALRVAKPGAYLLAFGGTRTVHRLTVALEDAGWVIRDLLVWAYAQGFPKSKSSLKPAWEPIVLARKPGPLAPLAIDECRLPTSERLDTPQGTAEARSASSYNLAPDTARLQAAQRDSIERTNTLGRWPANVVLTDPIFDGGVDGVEGGGKAGGGFGIRGDGPLGGRTSYALPGQGQTVGYGDSGTYSRFFLVPKSSRSDREPVAEGGSGERVNVHPT